MTSFIMSDPLVNGYIGKMLSVHSFYFESVKVYKRQH